MAIVLMVDDAKDWFYKGEGAANLVLGYCGSSPSLVSKVLRIQKVPRGQIRVTDKCEVLSAHERLLWQDIGELVEAASNDMVAQVYATQVMSPLLGSKHIDGGVRVIVSREFLEFIDKNVHGQRPAWRVNAAEIDTLCRTALLVSDHSVFSNGILKEDICFAVELKPKCGFLPTSEFIAKRNDIKKHVTRFRMHQLLKLHQGEATGDSNYNNKMKKRSIKYRVHLAYNNFNFITQPPDDDVISQLSEYDPLDLFSGSKERISQAIKALITTPQNNFRIFVNGSLSFGGLGGGMNNSEYKTDPSSEDQLKVLIQKTSGLQLTSFVELVAEAIFQSRALDQLLAVQKLDVYDIEGVVHLYYKITSQPCLVCKNLSDVELLHQYSLLHSLSLEESLQIVREYLIAATAKDCSLIISFRPTSCGDSISNPIFLKSSNQKFDYKANFIDLDLKHLEKMIHYYELDQKIVNLYANSKEIEGKICNSTSECIENKLQCKN